MCSKCIFGKSQILGDEQAVEFNVYGTSASTLRTLQYKKSKITGREVTVYKGHRWIIHVQSSQLESCDAFALAHVGIDGCTGSVVQG